MRCPTCGRKHKRSNPANAAYWALLHEIADTLRPNGEMYSAESFHAYFKSRFLGVDEVRLPNGDLMRIPKSTADLDADAFSEYLSKVEADAAQRGVFLDELPA
jgi:hypothetical protein